MLGVTFAAIWNMRVDLEYSVCGHPKNMSYTWSEIEVFDKMGYPWPFDISGSWLRREFAAEHGSYFGLVVV